MLAVVVAKAMALPVAVAVDDDGDAACGGVHACTL